MIDIRNKKPDFNKLAEYGFKKSKDCYCYSVDILNNLFNLEITISNKEHFKTRLTDNLTKEPYTLHLMEGAEGTFVGEVRAEYEKITSEIIEKCFENNIFKSEYAHKIIEFVKKEFGDDAEYLWEKFPNNAVFRRQDTKKWYGAILTVKECKLGFPGERNIEVLDLRMLPEEKGEIIDNKHYFEGYHMNKKSWMTVCLDNPAVPLSEIYKRIRKSYELAYK